MGSVVLFILSSRCARTERIKLMVQETHSLFDYIPARSRLKFGEHIAIFLGVVVILLLNVIELLRVLVFLR